MGRRLGVPSRPGSCSGASQGPVVAWIRRLDVVGARRGLDPAPARAGKSSGPGWLVGDGRKAPVGWGGVARWRGEGGGEVVEVVRWWGNGGGAVVGEGARGDGE